MYMKDIKYEEQRKTGPKNKIEEEEDEYITKTRRYSKTKAFSEKRVNSK